jgi:YD repeat-containing protein
MNELHKAYQILGLDPGSPKETIQRRWKRLAMVWHPDRFPNEEGKKDAEEELKKINHAKDVLWKHFESGSHRASGCECQPGATDEQSGQTAGHRSGPSPGPGRSRTGGGDPEDEAKRRDAERKRRAAEEAARQQQQAQEKAQQQSYQTAQQQEISQKEDKLRWKVATTEAIVFAGLCIFGWIGSGINTAIHNWQAEEDQKARQKAADEAKKNDPCQSGTSQTPPNFAQANIKDTALAASKLWRTNCKGIGQGAIVTGEDEKGRLIAGLYYGPNLTYQGQWLVSYDATGNQVTVQLWNAPTELAGSTVYSYDASHNLTEIRRLDAQSQPLVIGTIERRPGGGFFAVDTQFISGNVTTKFYTPDDPQLTKNFYLCDVFGRIPKQIDPMPTATSPDSTPSSPAYIPTGDLAEHFKNRASPFASPFSSPGALTPFSSTSTGTSSDDHLTTVSPFSTTTTSTNSNEHIFKKSPFGPSSDSNNSPGMDALNKQLEKQNK